MTTAEDWKLLGFVSEDGLTTTVEERIIEQAEKKAQLEWDREHGLCEHQVLLQVIEREYPFCLHCKLEIVE